MRSFQFYNAMKKKSCSHHDAIHLIGSILFPLMYPATKAEGSFNVETYRELLRKYKARNPEKIGRLLEEEPDAIWFLRLVVIAEQEWCAVLLDPEW